METTITNQTFTFSKEQSGRWYINIPEYTGPHEDLEMVNGADTVLSVLAYGADEVKLILSEQPFENAYILQLIKEYEKVEVSLLFRSIQRLNYQSQTLAMPGHAQLPFNLTY
jgi:hypothetical protein